MADGQKRNILLADDSVTIQKVVELTFSEGNYEVRCVSNGVQAMEALGEIRPDIVLCDVIMPEKNGYEVCEEIKSGHNTRGIPVILLTGTFEPFDQERADQAGADAIVTKPFDSSVLIEKVEELLANQVSLSEPDTGPAQIVSGGQEFTADEPAAPAPAPEPVQDPSQTMMAPPQAEAPTEEPAPMEEPVGALPDSPGAEAAAEATEDLAGGSPFSGSEPAEEPAPIAMDEPSDPGATMMMTPAPMVPGTDAPAEEPQAMESEPAPMEEPAPLEPESPAMEEAAPLEPEAPAMEEPAPLEPEAPAMEEPAPLEPEAPAMEEPAPLEPEAPGMPPGIEATDAAEAPAQEEAGALPQGIAMEEDSAEELALEDTSEDAPAEEMALEEASTEDQEPTTESMIAPAHELMDMAGSSSDEEASEERDAVALADEDEGAEIVSGSLAEMTPDITEPESAEDGGETAEEPAAQEEEASFEEPAAAEEAPAMDEPAEESSEEEAFAAEEAPAEEEVQEAPQEAEPAAAESSAPAVASGPMTLDEETMHRIAELVVQKMSPELLKEVAWEVIPEMAEVLIKNRIRELEEENR